jgi:hypothetical protein
VSRGSLRVDSDTSPKEAIPRNHRTDTREWKIHNVFHVSLLEKVNPDNWNRTPIPVPPVMVEGQEEFVVETIKNARIFRGKLQYLIKWEGYDLSNDKWENEEVVHADEKIREFYIRNPNAVRSPPPKRQAPKQRKQPVQRTTKKTKSHR